MMEDAMSETPKCGSLTFKAKKQEALNRVEIDSDLWHFVKSWIRRFPPDEPNRADKQFERFIFLWVSVNAWASIAVPDQSKNHEDAYLVHSMAQDPHLTSIFNDLRENTQFNSEVNSFVALAPVFQVLWLRNHNVPNWLRDDGETRAEYITQIFTKDPFHRIRRRENGQIDVIPAFSPACALTHILAKEPIPDDWPHVLSMIYQVRCNLFHGGKSYESSSDLLFVDYAFKILWRVWRKLLPAKNYAGFITWERLFIRSGVICQNNGNEIDLSGESDQNIEFLCKVLGEIGWAHRLGGRIFCKPPELIEQQEWLNAWESLRSGAEAGPIGFDNIDLAIMDTHISGVVRWLNGLGYKTSGISCEGHGRGQCFIELANKSDEAKVAELIANNSNGIRFDGGKLVKTNASGKEVNPSNKDLLDLGESLHSLKIQL